MALLEVKDLVVCYGLIKAIKGISFEVNEGEIVSLIGANGAAKSTALRAICGIIPVTSGTVTFEGKDITNLPPYKRVSLGMAQVPEGRRIFKEQTVYDNLVLGFYTRRDKKEFKESLEKMYTYFPILKERSKQIAGTLSGGEQQMLAMSRALMSKPKLVFMDEPSMGLSPIYVNTIFDIAKEINKDGTTILLVEQNAKKALAIADRAYVLEIGRVILEGRGEELLHNETVRKAYLGG